MSIFLISIFTVDYFIKLDIIRHKSGLIETKQFAVQISKIPKTNEKYGVDQLKAELWNHVIKGIKAYDKEQLKLTNNEDKEEDVPEVEIVDIQFAMDNYSHLDPVKDILSSSNRIEEIDIQLRCLETSTTEYDELLTEHLEIEKKDLLESIDESQKEYHEKHDEFVENAKPI